MDRVRLKAPSATGAIVVDPPITSVDALLTQNHRSIETWRYDFQGRSAERLRAMTRAAVLDAAYKSRGEASSLESQRTNQESPLILTGHQPELFHPGVWIKNFASYAIAQKHGGVSLHLIVDNDTVKKTTVRVPTGTADQPSVVHVPFDRWRGEIPYEEYEVADECLFDRFGKQVVAAIEPLGVQAFARDFWPVVVDAARRTARLSERIAAARRTTEAAWGCHNLELPVSRLCQTEGFYWFACHLFAQLGHFHDEYNRLLADYRRRHRIRSRHHPVPSLARDGDWLEAPFWVWSECSPRRRRLFVRHHGNEVTLTDRDAWTHTLPLARERDACCAVEVLYDLARRGIKIRTRALTTTIFSRLCLADLFIHGIGGARYDELTDEILHRFFGLEPPKFLTLTGTLHLPVTPRQATSDGLRDFQRLLRDLAFNPDRHLPPQLANRCDVAELVESKRRLVAAQPSTSAARRNRFESIRQINEQLFRFVGVARVDATQRMEAIRAGLDANAILQGRDWAFCLYTEETLRRFFSQSSLAS